MASGMARIRKFNIMRVIILGPTIGRSKYATSEHNYSSKIMQGNSNDCFPSRTRRLHKELAYPGNRILN